LNDIVQHEIKEQLRAQWQVIGTLPTVSVVSPNAMIPAVASYTVIHISMTSTRIVPFDIDHM